MGKGSRRSAVEPALPQDVLFLGGRLRQGDVEEIAAASGREPMEALQRCFDYSEVCWTGTYDGVPVCMFGAVRAATMSHKGIPWMLGSEGLDQAGVEVGKGSMHYLTDMLRRFAILENWIDARQKRSIRWLRWLGFHVEPAVPFGVAGLPFHRFWRFSHV